MEERKDEACEDDAEDDAAGADEGHPAIIDEGHEAPPIRHFRPMDGTRRSLILSEDYWVCETLRRLGFAIHVDPVVVTQHSGVMKA